MALYYLSSENKGTDQLCNYCTADIIAQLICAFVSAYAKIQFSHDAVHIILDFKFFFSENKSFLIREYQGILSLILHRFVL